MDPHRALIASTALSMYGMNTAHLTGAGVDACAAAVQQIFKKVFGEQLVGGGGDPAWVPDLRAGLVASGNWSHFDVSANALPGDIAIQNGTHNGTATNPYENHIGVVVTYPEGSRELRTISNGSKEKAFVYIDDLEFSHIGYPRPKIGPTRFYRYKAT